MPFCFRQFFGGCPWPLRQSCSTATLATLAVTQRHVAPPWPHLSVSQKNLVKSSTFYFLKPFGQLQNLKSRGCLHFSKLTKWTAELCCDYDRVKSKMLFLRRIKIIFRTIQKPSPWSAYSVSSSSYSLFAYIVYLCIQLQNNFPYSLYRLCFIA